jgi:preprotein translocase subunit YajC
VSKNKILNVVLIVGLLLALIFVVGCYPTTTPPEGGEATDAGSIAPLIIFLVLIFALMYFTMIRPQRKRQKEQQELLAELNRGDKIITAGGIYGTIESVSEDTIVIKVESGATMRVLKSSIINKRER